MKKVLAILLTVVLVLSMAGAGTAGSLDKNTPSGTTNVIYEVGDSYTVIIPNSIVIDATSKKGTGTVGLPTTPAPIIDSEMNVNVYVKSKNKWNLVNESYFVNYSMTVAAAGYFNLDPAFASGVATVYAFTPTTPGVDTNYNDPGQIGTLIYSAPSTGGRSQTDLTFELIGTVPHSGLYQDELTFTVVLLNDDDTRDDLDIVKEKFPSATVISA